MRPAIGNLEVESRHSDAGAIDSGLDEIASPRTGGNAAAAALIIMFLWSACRLTFRKARQGGTPVRYADVDEYADAARLD